MFLPTRSVLLLILATLIPFPVFADPLSTDEASLWLDSTNQLAFELYRELMSENSKNLFFSPSSIAICLSMTYAGAEGETKREMAKVLHTKSPEQSFHASCVKALQILNTSKSQDYQLRLANRVWVQMSYPILPKYREIIQKQYHAQLETLDFRFPEKSQVKMSHWVEQKTNHQLRDSIPGGLIEDDTRLVLMNTAHFRAAWQVPFDKEDTEESPFTNENGKQIQIPLMYQKHIVNYVDNRDLQMLELPYRGNTLSMYIILPKDVDGLPAVEKQITLENIHQWISAMEHKEVKIYLPRFRLQSKYWLKSTLCDLGMASAFDAENADFSGITAKRDFFLDEMLHAAVVEVDERGTKASATSILAFDPLSVAEPPVFRADHPFIF